MELSENARNKIGSELYQELVSAPEKRFTRADEVTVCLTGPADQAKAALDSIEGLKVEHHLRNLGCAIVSGSAKAIAAMLELPEVTMVASMNIPIMPIRDVIERPTGRGI